MFFWASEYECFWTATFRQPFDGKVVCSTGFSDESAKLRFFYGLDTADKTAV